MKKSIQLLNFCALVVSLALMNGCGGSSVSQVTPASRSGIVKFQVNWSQSNLSRVIPEETVTLLVAAHDSSGRKLKETSVARPLSTGELTDVPTGPQKFRALAVSSTGKLLASGEIDHKVSVGSNSISLVLSEVLDEVDNDRYVIGGTVALDPVDPSFVRIDLNALIESGGEPVTDLNETNFVVLEDGIRKLPITVERATEGSSAVDIVFVLDTTFSMDGEIAGVRNSVVAFAESLSGTLARVRFGGVSFGDEVRGTFSLNADVSAFQSWVSNLQSFGGNDTPENPLDAVLAGNNLGWSAGAQRLFVIITDAPAHEQDEFTSASFESVKTALGTSAVVHTVSPGGAGRSLRYQPNDNSREVALREDRDVSVLAGSTGGVSMVLPSSGNVDLNALPIADLIKAGYVIRFRSVAGVPPIDRLIRLSVLIEGVPTADQLFPGRY
jgi:hypothetical protein